MPFAITAEGLGRRYGKHWAVRDLTLHIERGEVFGLLGPNGAGKTTTMRMLACLVAPSTGSASVADWDIASNPTEVRKRVGILTDTAGLYETLSAQENLQFFAKLYDLQPAEAVKRTEHYLKLLGLWDRRRDPAGSFSSGMKQKLSMARALIHEPSVLLLDEPTSALDPEGAKLVRDFVYSLKGEGRTIILCTHNLSEAQSLCDRVAIIKRTLLRVGTPRQLQTSLYGRQVEFQVRWNGDSDDGRRTTDDNVDLPTSSVDERGALRSANSRPTSATEWSTGPSSTSVAQDEERSMNDLAVAIATMYGVGDVVVAFDRLLVSMEDPDQTTPAVVRFLVHEGVEVLRVAEIEHSLERAYLDLVARQDEVPLDGSSVPSEERAA
jgi:ABC-2 type transport system ATP-binding protein